MRYLLILAFSLFFVWGCVETCNAQHKKFGELPIVRVDSLSREFKTVQWYTDSASHKAVVLTDLKVKFEADDILVFENGNPLSNSSAMVIRNVSQDEYGLLLVLKRMFESYNQRKVTLTGDELENLRATVGKWLSDKTVNK